MFIYLFIRTNSLGFPINRYTFLYIMQNLPNYCMGNQFIYVITHLFDAANIRRIFEGDRSLIFYFERGRESGVRATSVFRARLIP